MKKQLLFCLLILISVAQGTIQSDLRENNYLAKIAPIGLSSGIAYGTMLSGAAAHEYGHALTARAFSRSVSQVRIPLNPFKEASILVQPSVSRFACFSNAAISLAGPLAGIAYNYSLLKAANIYQEYKKNGDLLKAVEIGSKKSFIDKEQNTTLQLVTSYNIYRDIANLFPKNGNDGCHIFENIFQKQIARNNRSIPRLRFAACGIITVAQFCTVYFLAQKIANT